MNHLTKLLAKVGNSRRNQSSKGIARERFGYRLRPLFESLETRALLAGFVGIPNDPDFPGQWALHNTGQTGGTVDADIDAPEAWSVTTGSMATVVAILDDGVDYAQANFYLNIWLNEREIPANIAVSLADTDSDGIITFRDLNAPANSSYVTNLNGNTYIDGGDLLADPSWENGQDEDGNGRIDDLVGWDFKDNDNDPQPIAGENHGTDKSRIIGAMGNDGFGSAGLNWSVRMIPLRIDKGAPFLNANVAAALDYSVASGAPISYNGWRGNPPDGSLPATEFSQQIYDAIDRARFAGQLFVAAAGNGSRDSDAQPWYPGAYDLDNIITAAALSETGDQLELSILTNWGATSVDIGVPSYGGATSNALALTTGVAALLKSAHPDWTYAQIKGQIMATVDPLLSLAGKTVTGGRLNAANALGVVQATKFYVVDDATTNRTFEYGRGVGLAGETYALSSGNTSPRGAASNAAGDQVWVVDANKQVYVYDTSGGLLGSWSLGSLASNATVEGITTNGTDIWIVDSRSDKVFKYAGAATRTTLSQSAFSSFPLNRSNTSPTDLVTDGTSIWVLNNTSSTDKVFKYSVDGSLLGSWTITSGGGSPTGLTIDPTTSNGNIWIVDNNTDRVYQFDSATTRTRDSASPSSSFALATGNSNPQGIADPPPPASKLTSQGARVASGKSIAVVEKPNRKTLTSSNPFIAQVDSIFENWNEDSVSSQTKKRWAGRR